jgi:hypothetical protein
MKFPGNFEDRLHGCYSCFILTKVKNHDCVLLCVKAVKLITKDGFFLKNPRDFAAFTVVFIKIIIALITNVVKCIMPF